MEHFASLGGLHIQTVNLDDLLAEELTHLTIPDGVSLFIDQPPVFPPIQADPDQLRLLIHHLLDNAFQAVGGSGVVKIGLKPVAEGVRLEVEDSGPGIPPEQLDLIFEPLFTTQEHGFGLGLAICQRVAQLHGGTITVESTVGEGSKFTVYLPSVPRQTPDRMVQDAAA
ncbi:MAG: ATP-binding protein [Caldilineae bacterium]|nr:MAG: ATP-binding protein [Caldilineae bacterium]